MASIRMTTKFAQPHVCQVCRNAHRASASSSRRRNLSRRGTRIGFRSRPRGHARVRSRGRARSCGVLRHVHQRPFLWVSHEDVQIAILWIFHPMETQFILCCSGRRPGRRPRARPRSCPLRQPRSRPPNFCCSRRHSTPPSRCLRVSHVTVSVSCCTRHVITSRTLRLMVSDIQA